MTNELVDIVYNWDGMRFLDLITDYERLRKKWDTYAKLQTK